MGEPLRATTGWALAERGSRSAIRVGATLQRLLGRRGMRALLGPIALYFWLLAPDARRASRDYLSTLWRFPGGRESLGRPPGHLAELRHIREFATNILDRTLVWGGALEAIHFEHRGSEHLFRLAREKRGGILLGSHLGSFDLMHLLARKHRLVVNVLMFTAHSERITAFFQKLDPESRLRVIQMDPFSVRTAFEVRACLKRGEFVGILADRLPPGPHARPTPHAFLGRSASWPLQPFLLAAVLGAPLLLATCVRSGEDHYRAEVALLHPGGVVPRSERETRARNWLGHYVACLEQTCLEAPTQWFNFYDFWATAPGDTP